MLNIRLYPDHIYDRIILYLDSKNNLPVEYALLNQKYSVQNAILVLS